ncbi:serine hydrolase domain-containing protein [Sphaerochaeta sp.]|uniref:serine hydrolase domain-containing protein n=1 Tax=Sphaerochaeta sp. TaxID=1972642 RepID=UPI002FC73D77
MSNADDMHHVSDLVETWLHASAFTAVAIGMRSATESWTKSWGHVSSEGEELKETNLFDLASLTKLFTTACVLRLIDQGRLSEHQHLLPLLGYTDVHLNTLLKDLEISALLTHHSGLPAWYPFYTRNQEPLQTILSRMLHELPLETGMMYSDLNFILLGELVKVVTGMPLEDAMQHLVLDPLHLDHTTYHPDAFACVATEFGNRIEHQMVHDRGLTFSSWRDEQQPIQGMCDDGNAFYYFGGVAGHAGLFASLGDVLSFAWTFCKQDPSFLSPALYQNACRDQGDGRGYGFQFGELYPQGGFGHTGFTGTYVYLNRERDVAITILTNRLHAPVVRNINAFRLDVVNALLKTSAV